MGIRDPLILQSDPLGFQGQPYLLGSLEIGDLGVEEEKRGNVDFFRGKGGQPGAFVMASQRRAAGCVSGQPVKGVIVKGGRGSVSRFPVLDNSAAQIARAS